MRVYRVYLKRNEYTGWDGSGEIYVRDFDRYSDALSFVRESGYVQSVAKWTNGKAQWQSCYRIERSAA